MSSAHSLLALSPPSSSSTVGPISCQANNDGAYFRTFGINESPEGRVYTAADGSQHKCLRNEGNKYKCCQLCLQNKIKTKRGWRAYTHFKCEQCDVSLCTAARGQRNCFDAWHELKSGKQQYTTLY